MFNIEIQKSMLEAAIDELETAGVPVTGVYMPTSETDAGVEIDEKYILQIADYCAPSFILDTTKLEEVAEFNNVSELISFLMDK